MRSRLSARAFTLVELLVVIAIIGILIALLSSGPRNRTHHAVQKQSEANRLGVPGAQQHQ
jgi:prepilin-type N-terminal cleavage/methylation domain-containing protein